MQPGTTLLQLFMAEALSDFQFINHLSVRQSQLFLALGEAPQRRPGNSIAGLVKVDLNNGSVHHWHRGNSMLEIDDITRLHWLTAEQLAITSFGGGVWLLQPDNSLTAFELPDVLKQSQLTDMLTDRQGDLWLSSYDQGVWQYLQADKRWLNFRHHPMLRTGLQSNAIFGMFQDQADSLWFISHTGFSQLSVFARQVQVLPAGDDATLLSSSDVFGIDVVAEDEIWLANRSSGLARYNPTTGALQKWPLPPAAGPGASPTLARSVKKIANEIWLGTDHGVFRLMPNAHWQLLALPLSSQPHISAIFRDQKRRTWLASRTDGVFVLDADLNLLAHLHPGSQSYALPFKSVTVMYEDNLGDVWLGSVDQGLARINSALNHIEHWHQGKPAGQALVYNGVQAIYEENDHVFVRAGNLNHRMIRDSQQPGRIIGVKVYQQNSDTDQALKDAIAFNLMYRFIWSEANQGFIQLGASHGVQEATWIGSSAVAFNKVYRGGRQGLDIYPLQLSRQALPAPRLVLHQLSLFNQAVRPAADTLLPAPLTQMQQLSFTYQQDMFSLHFAAPDFLQSDQLQYRYMLEGFDRDWLAINDNNRMATYTRLPAGQYQWLLSARYEGGAWQAPISLQINVLPAWWKTWWFRLLLLLLVFGGLGVLVAWRFYNERRHRRELEQQVAARTEQLKQQHLALQDSYAELKTAQQQLVTQEKMASLGALVAGVAHEINTPLGICVTATSHLHSELEQLMADYQQKGLQKSQFERFLQHFDDGLRILHSNTRRAAELVQSFKQVSVDQSSDSVRHVELTTYLPEVLLSLQPQLKKLRCDIALTMPEKLPMHTDAGAIAQIITNLVMNSLTHGLQNTEQPQIFITVQQEGKQVLLQFVDNGCGMPAADLARLFDPFFTTKRHQGGTGLGTHIVYNLVTARFKGRIDVSCPPQQGLHYNIWLPLKMEK